MSKTIKLIIAGVVGTALLGGVLVAANLSKDTESEQNDTTQETQTAMEENQATQANREQDNIPEAEATKDSAESQTLTQWIADNPEITTHFYTEGPLVEQLDTPMFSIEKNGAYYALAIANQDLLSTSDFKLGSYREELDFLSDNIKKSDLGNKNVRLTPFERATLYDTDSYQRVQEVFSMEEYGPLTVDYLDNAYHSGNTVYGRDGDSLVYIWPIDNPSILNGYDVAYIQQDTEYSPSKLAETVDAFSPAR